ncbi:hypothetical protein [Fibrobacter succinogenes]|uniref:hypothetical protein n=1 Tax=Fibrobacter succinogenes TaxID=833 RepID=UPI0015696BB2|nr:hypothetical protein [Fibrobacter succinogenes]
MNFKHLFLTTLLAASFGLVACDNSSSAESSDDNSNKKSGQTYCNVTTTAKSVTVSMALDGEATYTSTVTDAGSRYKTISSEYWYASSSDANKECNDQKKEAASWRDGSYQVSCSGNKIYVSEIDEGSLSAHESDFRDLCRQFDARYGSSSGQNNSTTNTNNGSNAEFSCDVSRTVNSVTMLFSYKGFTFETSSSLLGAGSEVSSVTNMKNVYPNKERANYECESLKRTAAGYPEGSYQISCSDKTVSITMIGDGDDEFVYMDGYADSYCETTRKAYNNGELDDMYEGF